VLHACQRVFCFYGLLALWGLCAHLYEHPPTNSTLSSIWAPTVGRNPPPLNRLSTLYQAEGRLEEAENLEKLLKAQMAQIDRNQSLESKTILHLQEMDKTVTMIGEHLSAGILKGGAVDHQELSKSIPFLDKCIPLLKSQIQMVEPVLPEISAAEQAKYAKIIDSAKKSIQLMQSLIELHERELFSYVQSL